MGAGDNCVSENSATCASSEFFGRHLGVDQSDIQSMLKALGEKDLDGFVSKVVPGTIRTKSELSLTSFSHPNSEVAALERLAQCFSKNRHFRSYIGMGYHDCLVPAVIQRNILENPGWYTQYTPYQPEISQGRLEALLNFQTMIIDLTAMDIANASMLDEATAAAEAMNLCFNQKESADTFLVSSNCHPQTISVLQTRAEPIGIKIVVGDEKEFKFSAEVFGALVQYPDTFGELKDYKGLAEKAHASGAMLVVAADLLALTVLKAPGEFGADVVVGSAQRFGVPLGFGGPHAAFFATRDAYKRSMPGRLIGVSKDSEGNPALRLALQTREQHIRREKATSNICTAQVLLAIMASMYAVYHGPKGLKKIAERVRSQALQLAASLKGSSVNVLNELFFDTFMVEVPKGESQKILVRAAQHEINLRFVGENRICIALDERTNQLELRKLLYLLTGEERELALQSTQSALPKSAFDRSSKYLAQQVFNSYHSETEFLRYVKRLEAKDLSLAVAMIPLGSCTMKLNATSEMLPVSWANVNGIHPFAPKEQWLGYAKMFTELEKSLAEITGFSEVSLQPNAGSQGEYAGLLAIRNYLRSRGEGTRNVCLIPKSAHGTNPASAVMAGLKVVVVECDSCGNVDLGDLKKKAEEHAKDLAALMITYPSTHGVFEEKVREICEVVHAAGGQVYMDGANLNALVGLVKPAEIGADVCHINLHKTFCIPHGGGGPGMGPIGVKAHLAPFLPGNPLKSAETGMTGPVSAAEYGSASILVIPWMYMAMMAGEGLTLATKLAILNANYVARRLDQHYPVLYKGDNGFVAHECILDLRAIEKTSGIKVEDVAKRLMDYGFHAPTVSFPVAGTLMVEPTESESLAELDRFCEAMIAIRAEIRDVESGKSDKLNNPLKNAPHTALAVTSDNWDRPYSREVAAFPTAFTRAHKFWPAVARVDSAFGDKNLVCSCPDISEY